MTGRLADFLTEQHADPARLQHAVRYLIAEWAADPPPQDMREQLIGAGITVEQLDRILSRLLRDSQLLEAAALSILQAAWHDETLQPMAAGAIGDADIKLPVIEAGLIALVAMYGMYLAKTGGRKHTERVIRRLPDGTYEETESTDWYGPTGPLSAVASVLHPAVLETGDPPEDADSLRLDPAPPTP
jgi:hypothetical protein